MDGHIDKSIRKAQTELRAGYLSRANRALFASPPFVVTPENEPLVRGLFPPEPALPAAPIRSHTSTPRRLETKDVLGLIRKKSRRTGAGPSGTSIAQAKDLVDAILGGLTH
jgi:hypothetical protein